MNQEIYSVDALTIRLCTGLTGPAKGLQPDFNYKEEFDYYGYRNHLMEAWEYLPSGFFPVKEVLYVETKDLNVCSLDDLQETYEGDY